MTWQDQLNDIVREQSAAWSFERWLDATGQRNLANHICSSANTEFRARAIRTLYAQYRAARRSD